MNKEKDKIQEAIDRVTALCNTGSVLVASNEEAANKLREMFPNVEIKVIFNTPNIINNPDTFYIIPAEERPIKIVYED